MGKQVPCLPEEKVPFVHCPLTKVLHMKSWYIVAITVIKSLALSGQQLSPSVIASDGGTVYGAGILLEYTLGEVAIEGLGGQAVIITEGFHQPYIRIEKVESDDVPAQADSMRSGETVITLAPNPVSEELLIKFHQPLPATISIQVRDIHGMILLQKEISPNDLNPALDFSSFLPGIYFVQWQAPGQDLRGIYKISKIQ